MEEYESRPTELLGKLEEEHDQELSKTGVRAVLGMLAAHVSIKRMCEYMLTAAFS
jgi:hypothetical protein